MTRDITTIKTIEDGIDFFNEEIAGPPKRLETGVLWNITPIQK